MNKQTSISEEIKIRNVYLSDLHLIKCIYKESKNLTSDINSIRQDSSLLITEGFGLPIALAHFGKEVIGYAYVIFNELNQPEIHQLFKQEFEKEEAKEVLERYAEKILKSMYNTETQDYSRLDLYIKKFIDWLNWCD